MRKTVYFTPESKTLEGILISNHNGICVVMVGDDYWGVKEEECSFFTGKVELQMGLCRSCTQVQNILQIAVSGNSIAEHWSANAWAIAAADEIKRLNSLLNKEIEK